MLGRQTPLYLAAKKQRAEACELLIAHGASLESKSFGKTVKEVLGENLPHLDPSKVKRVPLKSPLKSWSVNERLCELLDQAQMNLIKGRSNAQNHLTFTVFLQQVKIPEYFCFSAVKRKLGMGPF